MDDLLSRLPGCVVAETRGPGEAGRLAARAVEAGHDPIIVAGGDGLFAEVVNGLRPDPGRTRLGLLPLGAGNDLARALAVSRNLEEALETILAERPRAVDAARLRVPAGPGRPAADRWLVNALVTGLAGRVARRAHRDRKRRWGGLAYRISALPELLRSRPERTVLELEDPNDSERLELSAHAVAVANGPFAGGGVRIAPGARVDDGRLDVVAVPDLGRRALSLAALRILAGADDGGRFLRWRAGRVRVAIAGEAWLDADGESLAGSEATIEILPRALRVLAPPDRAPDPRPERRSLGGGSDLPARQGARAPGRPGAR